MDTPQKCVDIDRPHSQWREIKKRSFFMLDEKLDRPIYGGPAIGRAANLLDEDGEVATTKVYRALRLGLIDADKFGREWVTTLRRIYQKHAGTGGAVV